MCSAHAQTWLAKLFKTVFLFNVRHNTLKIMYYDVHFYRVNDTN